VEVGLGLEAVPEAMERAEQGVDLVERVLTSSSRLDTEVEVDLVVTVADPQPQTRLRDSAPDSAGRCVLDEDSDEGAAVEVRIVEDRPLVHANATSRATLEDGTPRRVLEQIGHCVPPFDESLRSCECERKC